MDFKTFKNIYGHSDAKGMRTVRVGDNLLQVDNKNYTFQVAPPQENESRRRLLGQVHQSAQGLKKNPDAAIMPQINENRQEKRN